MKRRQFIKKTTASLSLFSIVPSYVLGKRHIAPSDTLYLANFGVGGRGKSVLDEFSKLENVKFVAFCDVDDRQAIAAYKAFPKVKHYRDYRTVFDKHINDIDAVVVATPDHTHAHISLPFMNEKKHAYVEKPLAHSIYQTRLMNQVATEKKLITQMGNQGSSSDGIYTSAEIIQQGHIGKVHKVDCWTNRPVWPQGLTAPLQKEQIPNGLDWQLWLGPAKDRPYNNGYLPFKWRGWWDFGTGSLGDMGCHLVDVAFKALRLKSPYSAQGSCTTSWVDDFKESNFADSCPASSVVRLMFKHDTFGDIAFNWYDGGIMPKFPEGLKDTEIPGDWGGGTIFYGDTGILVVDTYGNNPRLLGERRQEPLSLKKTYPRIKDGINGHCRNFVDGCVYNKPTSSPFSYSGPLTETVLIGNLVIRAYQYKVLKKGKTSEDWDPYLYPGRKTLKWNTEKMEVSNFKEAQGWVKDHYRFGWEL